MPVAAEDVLSAVREISSQWRADRAQRQLRRHLDRADFDALRDSGLLSLVGPTEMGGAWEGVERSMRTLCSVYRELGRGDPSVALVSSMHPSVIAFWLASPDPSQAEWEEPRRAVFASAVAGDQWGTITSEPGSGRGHQPHESDGGAPGDGVIPFGRGLRGHR